MKPTSFVSRRTALAAACTGLLLPGLAAAQARPLRLAWIASVNSPQVAVALDRQLWKERGLEVAIISFATGREGLEALLGGQVDLVSMAELPVATAAGRGQRLAVIADLSRNHASRIVTTTDFASLKDLEGRKLGTTVGTNTHYQLEAAMAGAGVKATIVNAPPSDLVASLARRDIDGATMFPSGIPRARQALGARYRELPTPDYIAHSLIAASTQAMASRQAEIRQFLAGLLAADAIVASSPAVAQQAIVNTSRGGVLPGDLTDAWADHEFRVVMNEDLLKLLVAQSRWLATKGMAKGASPSEEQLRAYLAPGPLQALEAQRVTLR